MIKRKIFNGFGLILRWMFGLFFSLLGLVVLVSSPIIGIFILLGSLLTLPPIGKLIKRRLNFEISKGLRWLVRIIVIILFFVAIPPSEPVTLRENEVAYIKVGATTDSWDADAQDDGLLLNLMLFTDTNEEVRAKGNLEVSFYYGAGLFGDKKGKLIQKWVRELDVNDFSAGTCGDKKCGFINEMQLEYDKEYTFSNFDIGYLNVNFTINGKQFEAIEETIIIS